MGVFNKCLARVTSPLWAPVSCIGGAASAVVCSPGICCSLACSPFLQGRCVLKSCTDNLDCITAGMLSFSQLWPAADGQEYRERIIKKYSKNNSGCSEAWGCHCIACASFCLLVGLWGLPQILCLPCSCCEKIDPSICCAERIEEKLVAKQPASEKDGYENL